jgi:hypothetical protein
MGDRIIARRICRAPASGGRALPRAAGQSLIETCVTILLLCLIFTGVLQVSRIFAAREILQYAAVCGARAKTVGFNKWMVEKCIRTGAIANAGLMTTPDFEDNTPMRGLVARRRPGQLWPEVIGMVPGSAQFAIERARISEYLDTDNEPRANAVLNYEDWDSIDSRVQSDSGLGGGAGAMDGDVRVSMAQDYPLRLPAHRAFFAADSLALTGEFEMETHYPLYIDDRQR